MTPPRQGNDRARARRGPASADRGASDADRHEWLWGWHTVVAALENPARGPAWRLLATPERGRRLEALFGKLADLEVAPAAGISRSLPAGAVHQGVAMRAKPVAPTTLVELAQPAHGFLVMLDQITDPQNVGAIFRSAAAFGARGLIIQDRHAPPLAGALAKAAAGAVDKIPHAREVNLSRALERLEALGWRAVGLEADAPLALNEALDAAPTVLVLGSEGEGLRRLVREHCDAMVRIPMRGGFESLNVSAAAAVAFYELARAAG